MSDQVIPLTNSPNQSFTVQLQVDGNPLTLILTLTYSTMAGYWIMSISDSNGNLLLDSIPLLTGLYPAANILAQYGFLNIGSCYVLNMGSPDYDYPDNTNLGSLFELLWSDTAA